MKRGKKCGETKPIGEFYRAPGTRDGHRGECKTCNLAAQARKRHADPQANRDNVRRWQLAHPDKVAAKKAEYRASGKKRIYDRRSHLKRRFGISLDDYDRMLEEQGGGCALCGREPRPDISLHVDHDHATGRVRGLLCFRCNNALGDFDDDPSLLLAASRYLAPPVVERSPAFEQRLAQLKSITPAWESG